MYDQIYLGKKVSKFAWIMGLKSITLKVHGSRTPSCSDRTKKFWGRSRVNINLFKDCKLFRSPCVTGSCLVVTIFTVTFTTTDDATTLYMLALSSPTKFPCAFSHRCIPIFPIHFNRTWKNSISLSLYGCVKIQNVENVACRRENFMFFHPVTGHRSSNRRTT